jgi:hypothetical protein
VISLDTTRQRIGLSLKGVSTSEQIEWMSQREAAKAMAAEEAAEEDSVAEVEETVEETTAETAEAEMESAAAEEEAQVVGAVLAALGEEAEEE